MDQTKIKKFENQLQSLLMKLEELETISKASAAIVVLDQSSVGRLSRMDAMQGQQIAMESERRRKDQIFQIKAALKRIQENNFGYCLNCGEEIALGRLSIYPSVAHCVACAK